MQPIDNLVGSPTETLRDLVLARLQTISRTELAYRAGLTYVTIGNYLNGRSTTCNPEQMPRLAEALDITPARLAAALQRAAAARFSVPSS